MIEKLKTLLAHPVLKFLGQFAFPVLFVFIVFFFYPEFSQFQADSDEGIILMEAMLVDHGYSLYKDIWSDQPPLFPHLLAIEFRFVGYHVGFSRLIVLLFSAMLLWAGGRFLHRVWDRQTSILGMVMFLLLPGYLGLSAAVMIGLPSISFAMVAIWSIVEWHSKRKYGWLFISALFMGFSVLTKLFLGFLGPVICLGLLAGEYFYSGRKLKLSILLPPFIWGVIFSLILISAGIFWVGFDNLNQLWEMHLEATDLYTLDSHYRINHYLGNALGFVFLGLIGIIDAFKARKWLTLYAFAWALLAYLLLLNHYPVWSHHQLYVTIPIVLLSAHPVVGAIRAFWNLGRQKISWSPALTLQIITLLCVVGVLLNRLPETVNKFNLSSSWEPNSGLGKWKQKLIDDISVYKDETNWIVTDVPMYAFRRGLMVPPELAVFSSKRLATGELNEVEIIHVIETYQPEQVLIARFDLPDVREYLDRNYNQVYSQGEKGLYIRSDMEPMPIDSRSP
jgi:hypothetical protein